MKRINPNRHYSDLFPRHRDFIGHLIRFTREKKTFLYIFFLLFNIFFDVENARAQRIILIFRHGNNYYYYYY